MPFVLRSGKAIGQPRQEILFTFRDVPHLPTGFTGPTSQPQLRIGVNPAILDIDLVTNGRDDPFELENDVLHAEFGPSELSAYGEVLAELLEGDPTLSVRGDIAEQCWRIVSPVLAAWRSNKVRLDTYPAGTRGPASLEGTRMTDALGPRPIPAVDLRPRRSPT